MSLATQRTQLQTQLTGLETARQKELRKRDLPITRPSQAKLSYIEQQKAAIKGDITTITEYEAKNYQLKSGEWIDKAKYNKLNSAAKAKLNKLGIEKYNASVAEQNRLAEAEQAKFKVANVELGTGEWVSKEFYKRLSSTDKQYLNKHGVTKFNKHKEAEYEQSTVLLSTGERVDKKFYNELDKNAKDYLNTYGVTQFIGGKDKKTGISWGYLGVQKWLAGELEKNWKQVGGSWIKKTEWAKMSQYVKDYIEKFGIKAYNEMYIPAQKWLAETTTKQLEAQEAAIAELKDYGTTYKTAQAAYKAGVITLKELQAWKNIELFPKGREGYKPMIGYDLLAAWKGGVSFNTLLAAGFSRTAITAIKTYNTTMNSLKPYTDNKGNINIAKALSDKKVTATNLKAVGISDKDIAKAQEQVAWEGTMPVYKVQAFKLLRAITPGVAHPLFPVPSHKPTPEELAIGFTVATRRTQKFALVMTPVVSTVVLWDSMSPTWRAISIAMDVACLVPFARMAVASTKQGLFATVKMGALSGARASIGKDVIRLARAESAATKITAGYLSKAYGKLVGKYYTLMMNAQLRYMGDLAKVARLRQTGAANKMIDRAAKFAEASERNLVTKAEQFVKSTRGKVGFDDPRAATIMNDIPKDIARNTRSAVESLTISKANIKALEAEVRSAEATLKAAQEKFHDPSKWSDLLYDLMLKQSRLIQAKLGDVKRLQTLLIEARAKGKFVLAEKLQKELDTAIKSLEVEWGRSGFLTKGGEGGVATIAKPWTGLLSGEKTKTELVGLGRGTIAMRQKEAMSLGLQILPPAISKLVVAGTGVKTGKMEWTAPKETVKASEAAQVKAYTDTVIKAMEEAAIKAAQQNLTEAKIEAMAKAATAPILKTITSVKVKTAVKQAIRRVTPLRVKIPLKLPGDETLKLTIKQYAGILAWKQGIMYKMIYPPYGEKNIINSRKPIAGVKYSSGVGSAYKSIIAKGGTIPKVILRDLGIFDIRIVTPKGGKPKLHYKRDIKQRTRTTPGITGVR